ncbi:uncharacterized protein LOC141912288 [Tubulanus polymorphus]|uniref:uncharacterized protein LOC141912288 n=1 Tax=Tubulanus polymorphus TaxID=672921 RepID=UPI003DA474C1
MHICALELMMRAMQTSSDQFENEFTQKVLYCNGIALSNIPQDSTNTIGGGGSDEVAYWIDNMTSDYSVTSNCRGYKRLSQYSAKSNDLNRAFHAAMTDMVELLEKHSSSSKRAIEGNGQC